MEQQYQFPLGLSLIPSSSFVPIAMPQIIIIVRHVHLLLLGFCFQWVTTAAWMLPNTNDCRTSTPTRGPPSVTKINNMQPPRLHQGRRRPQPSRRRTVALSDVSLPMMMDSLSPFVVAGVALGLGVAAQGFINQMLEGDQGLGAFLKDGSGYKKSGFRRGTSSSNAEQAAAAAAADPLPWLKLPQLDFVEVAGQPSRQEEEALMKRLETLRSEMNEQLEAGKVEEATAIREELEAFMDEMGIEYSTDR